MNKVRRICLSMVSICLASATFMQSTLAVKPEETKSEKDYTIFSKLLEDRIIILSEEINNTTASLVVAQLLYLEGQDSSKDITLYINSPGGSVSGGLAIYDTMRYVKCDVSTVCMGMAASMGAFLLAAGTKGKRFALPNSEIMIHKPSGHIDPANIVHDQHIRKTIKTLNTILAESTGRTYEEVDKDTDIDYFMTASEAKEYGIIDEVIGE